MVRKSDVVKEAVRKRDWKKALQTAKDFHIGITQEQKDKMARAYECIIHPDFYRQIGIDIPETVEQGKAVVKEYVENVRRKNIMKWDVKHDLAKQVIDGYLERAGAEMLESPIVAGLDDEEKVIVSEELALMIASIRKRYKLQERLPEQKAKPDAAEKPVEEKTEEATANPEPAKKELAEKKPISLEEPKAKKAEEKLERGCKESETEKKFSVKKKLSAKRDKNKKTKQEENAEAEQETV